jgi:NTP pyrophosphatase (non-canonical NTP hydrolase)
MNTYQEEIKQFRVDSYTPEACVLGLLAESGEVAAVFQKMIRGDFHPDIAATKLHKELGDVLWHIAAIASDNNWTLEDIARENIEKLKSRQMRSMILGAGDDR